MSNDKKKGDGPRKLNRKEMEETKGGFAGFAGTLQTVKLNVNVGSFSAARIGNSTFNPGALGAGVADTTW